MRVDFLGEGVGHGQEGFRGGPAGGRRQPGRVLRFNSWDIVVRPRSVLRAVASHVVHPIRHFEASVFVALFAACLLYAYLMFRLGTKLVRSAR